MPLPDVGEVQCRYMDADMLDVGDDICQTDGLTGEVETVRVVAR